MVLPVGVLQICAPELPRPPNQLALLINRAQSFHETPSTGAVLQGDALAVVTGKCLLELVALLVEKGAKVLELRV